MPERVPKFEKREQSREKLIVEVGSGSLPVVADKYGAYRDLFDENTSARYIGIDLDPSELAHGKTLQERNDMEQQRAHNDRISYVNAHAESLPIQDASVDELILRNVLGDPDIPVEEKHAALHEAARVLKKNALLKVIEVYTPLMVHEDDLFTYMETMEGNPLVALTNENEDAISTRERSADHQLSRDEAAAHTSFGNQSFVRYYRRA